MRHEITETAWLSVKTMAAYLLQSFAESFKFSKYVHFWNLNWFSPEDSKNLFPCFYEKMPDIPWIEKCSPMRDLKQGDIVSLLFIVKNSKLLSSNRTNHSSPSTGLLLLTLKIQVLCPHIERSVKINMFFLFYKIFSSSLFSLFPLNSYPYQSMTQNYLLSDFHIN